MIEGTQIFGPETYEPLTSRSMADVYSKSQRRDNREKKKTDMPWVAQLFMLSALI